MTARASSLALAAASALDALADTRKAMLDGPGGAHGRGMAIVLENDRKAAAEALEAWRKAAVDEAHGMPDTAPDLPVAPRLGGADGPSQIAPVILAGAESIDNDRDLAEDLRRWAREFDALAVHTEAPAETPGERIARKWWDDANSTALSRSDLARRIDALRAEDAAEIARLDAEVRRLSADLATERETVRLLRGTLREVRDERDHFLGKTREACSTIGAVRGHLGATKEETLVDAAVRVAGERDALRDCVDRMRAIMAEMLPVKGGAT